MGKEDIKISKLQKSKHLLQGEILNTNIQTIKTLERNLIDNLGDDSF